MLKILIESINYKKYVDDKLDDSEDRWRNVWELYGSMMDFSKEHPNSLLDTYLAQIALSTELDNYEDETSFVTLMTLHNSKGLEFDIVFICGLNEGIFPHYRANEDLNELEEERRLFYVGVTRGKKIVYLSEARDRMYFGNSQYYLPSSFLDDLDNEYVEIQYFKEKKENVYASYKKKKQEIREKLRESYFEKGNFIKDKNEIQIGSIVSQKKLGKGIIEKIDDISDNLTMIVVYYDKIDERRKYMLQHAKLILEEF